MLRYRLTHPELVAALAAAGHGSTVLLADGNYPLATASGPAARRVYLNLRPGQVPVDDILATVLDAVAVEAARVMQPAGGPEPPIFATFRGLLGEVALEPLDRFAFYAAAREPDLAVAVASGDQRLYANILLTIGVLPPDWH
ncbi:MAG TPA: RbsD/FucU family protein [Asanoa sp.]